MNHVVLNYENYDEQSRLTTNKARRIEFLTTIRVLNEVIPDNAKLLDCAAGTGVYSFYYAERGCEVTALDITPKYVEYIKSKLSEINLKMNADINNAINLTRFEDETFDVVLCMGPIYHLIDEEDRDKCIAECKRVLKKGGLLAVAYISKFIVFPYISTSDRRFLNQELASKLLDSGVITHDDKNCFWTDNYFSTPEAIEELIKNHGIEIIDHLATDGITPFLRDKIDTLSDEEYAIWCDYHYRVCRERSLLGFSNHGLAIGRK